MVFLQECEIWDSNIIDFCHISFSSACLIVFDDFRACGLGFWMLVLLLLLI